MERLGMIYCYDPRNKSSRGKAVYHRFMEEKDGPKCKPLTGRMVKVHNIPQNRCPCIKCFGKRGRENAKR